MPGNSEDGKPPGWVPDEEPDWWESVPTSLSDLVDGVSDSAIEFLKNPRAWLASLVVGWFFDIFDFVGVKAEQFWGLLTGVLEGSGGAVYDSIASVGGTILGIFSGFESTLVDIASSGPFGMLAAILIWIAVAYGAVFVAAETWAAIKKLIPWVIPWI